MSKSRDSDAFDGITESGVEAAPWSLFIDEKRNTK